MLFVSLLSMLKQRTSTIITVTYGWFCFYVAWYATMGDVIILFMM